MTIPRGRLVQVKSGVLAHHFNDLDQQHSAATLCMWLFLATELLFFGGLFIGYTIYRVTYPEIFSEFNRHLNETLGTVNTAVLLTSSLTMALAVHAAREGHSRAIAIFMSATALLGMTFLAIKGVEYHQEYVDGFVPGKFFTYKGPHADVAELFFRFYFLMTGLHAFHMMIGLALMWGFVPGAMKGKFSGERYMPVEILGLYWHFVDLIWIFLFPLLYLIDRS
jgi:cytochrome c oxidase subunit III